MLAGMRNTAQQGLTTLIFGAIIVVFALNFGPGSVSQCGGNLPVAAKVNGRVIGEAEFTKEYSQRFQEMAMYRPGYTVEQAKAEGLKSQVLDAMIGRELLAQEAERRGLAVSADELREQIRKIAGFQTDGKFDKKKYTQYTHATYITEANFEQEFSRMLLGQKMRAVLEDLVTVSPTEAKDEYERQNNRADIEFVKFDPAFYRKDAPKPSADDAKKLIADDHKAIEEYYNTHATRYNEPRRVRARHILVKVPDSAPEADSKKAREKIDAAKARLDKGEDFATVAKEVSEDGSASAGGDLGMQGPGVWVKPFEDEATRLKAGETGGVIRTRFGFHIIKVEEIKEAQKREIKDVEEEIAKALVEERALKALAKAAADKALVDAKAGKALEVLFPASNDGKADPLAPKVEVTGWFNKGSKYVPRLGVAGDVVTAVFAASKAGQLDRVFDVNGRLYVVNVRERELADMAKYEEEREQIEERLKFAARSKVVTDFIKEQRDLSGKGIDVKAAAIGYDVRPSGSTSIDDM